MISKVYSKSGLYLNRLLTWFILSLREIFVGKVTFRVFESFGTSLYTILKLCWNFLNIYVQFFKFWCCSHLRNSHAQQLSIVDDKD